jgi:hypothetical protein
VTAERIEDPEKSEGSAVIVETGLAKARNTRSATLKCSAKVIDAKLDVISNFSLDTAQ